MFYCCGQFVFSFSLYSMYSYFFVFIMFIVNVYVLHSAIEKKRCTLQVFLCDISSACDINWNNSLAPQ
ncbi:hypothetical protein A4A49_10513 [Nicotiana attenuata]|uniref:Uncharacterized protein n=1 Tax=Nicotiana attenuata TaxID=49451 RepID=A0A314KRU8_NICAT|nr:hypothetical protein A4A49_10513 [Nicotiana attenuata]